MIFAQRCALCFDVTKRGNYVERQTAAALQVRKGVWSALLPLTVGQKIKKNKKNFKEILVKYFFSRSSIVEHHHLCS